MAFEFSTRDAERLFFPLLHVHDGELHADANFDHVLYAQGLQTHRLFEHRLKPLKHNLRNPHARLLVDLDSPLSRREMIGTLPNRDEWALLVRSTTTAAEGEQLTPSLRQCPASGDDEIARSTTRIADTRS